MATFFGSPPFVSHPIVRTQHLSSSSQPPPSPPPPPPESSQPISLRKSSQEPQQPLVVASDKAKQGTRGTSADSTDWIASSLTRRFGLGAGLAWAGFLTFGVVSEQIKTRFEVNQEEANTRDVEKEVEVVLPNGIRYYELRVGGGATPRKGDLVVIDIKGNVQGDGVFVDTFGRDKKPLALVVGSRPYSKGMCEGVEIALRSMKNGGKRRVIVPPVLGFGDEGADFGSGFKIPPSATLEYIVEVEKKIIRVCFRDETGVNIYQLGIKIKIDQVSNSILIIIVGGINKRINGWVILNKEETTKCHTPPKAEVTECDLFASQSQITLNDLHESFENTLRNNTV